MLIAAVLAAATLASHAQPQAGAGGIQMRAVRFWLPQAHKTSVLAMVEVPYALATPIGSGPDAYLAYQVIIRVRDDKGGLLDAEKWSRHVPAALRSENGSGMEQLKFGLVPGNYWLQVEVVDSASNQSTVDSIRLDGYQGSPGVSDLLIANRMRMAPPGDTTIDAGEVSRGDYRFVTAPLLHIDIAQPMMGFLMEAYSADSTTADLALTVASQDGSDVIPLMPVKKSIPAGGGVIASQFSLEGLPPGQYLLKAALTLNGKTIDRQAAFTVNAVEAALARSMSETNANRGLDEVYFNTMPEDSLDAAAEELVLLSDASARERAPYRKDELSLAAKRHFLIEFWAKRDHNKSTPENEDRINFYRAVGYANAHFGVRYTPGWKTARGRVFAKFGAPSDSLTDPMAGRGKVAFLVWRMTTSKSRWFIFGDRSNSGNYVVLRSNEQSEPGTPGWRELMDPEEVQNIAIWLGFPKNYFQNDN